MSYWLVLTVMVSMFTVIVSMPRLICLNVIQMSYWIVFTVMISVLTVLFSVI